MQEIEYSYNFSFYLYTSIWISFFCKASLLSKKYLKIFRIKKVIEIELIP